MNEYGKLATAAAQAGFHVHERVINDSAVTDRLDTLQRVAREQERDVANAVLLVPDVAFGLESCQHGTDRRGDIDSRRELGYICIGIRGI